MIVLIVKLQVKSEFRQQFVEGVQEEVRATLERKAGCLQLSVVQDNGDPNRFYLFEVYCDQAAIDAHQKDPAFQQWLQTSRAWQAGPPEIMVGHNIFPSDEAWRKLT